MKATYLLVAFYQLGQSRAWVAALRRLCYSLSMALMRVITCSVLLILPFVTVAEGAVENMSYVMCRSQKVVRTIRVAPGGDGCETIYTKAGVDRIVGTAKSKNSCMSVMKNIRTNLESADWKCKDVDTATLSNVAE